MNETTSTADADGTPGTNAPGYAFQDELHEAKVQAKHAARATLLAMRSALDFSSASSEMTCDRVARAETSQASTVTRKTRLETYEQQQLSTLRHSLARPHTARGRRRHYNPMSATST